MKELEQRTITKKAETRADESDGKKVVAGVIPYNVESQEMFLGYSFCSREKLAPTVFNKTLGDKADVYCNYAHNDEAILGNTKSGTLALENRDDGLHFTVELDPGNEIAMRAYSTIKRGDCTTLSFEFYPFEWEENKETDVCTLKSAKLRAISLCVIDPAYTETSSETIRSRSMKEMEKLTRAFQKREIDVSDKETLAQIKALLTEISNALPKDEPQEKQKEEPKEEPDSKPQEKPQPETKSNRDEPSPQPESTKTDEQDKDDEEDTEKKKQLEELQKELEEELSE